jgi:hypothetical protein
MRKPNREERAKRRARCEQDGLVRLTLLRSGCATQPEIEEMRAAVLRQHCPLCGESGFKIIAGHCQTMHGILSRELRDLLGLTYTESICSQETHLAMSEANGGRNPRAKKAPTGHRTYSKKGEAIRNGNLAPVLTWVSKDVLRENGRKVGLSRKGKSPWNKTYEHGTRAMFRQGCRCNLCSKAMKDYNKALNVRRRNKPSNE